MNLPGRFECFLLDLRQTQTVINIKTKISRELMLATLNSQITDACWMTLKDINVLLLSFSDGAFACIDSDGWPVKVVATSLFNKSVLGN